MTTIYIARHGQNEDNVRGILNGYRNLPLTDLGRQQARQLARHIKDRELVFDAVYASPLGRAFETAAVSWRLISRKSARRTSSKQKTARQHPDQTVLLACHGDIGKMIYAAATSTPWRQVLTDFYFGNTDIIGPVDVL